MAIGMQICDIAWKSLKGAIMIRLKMNLQKKKECFDKLYLEKGAINELDGFNDIRDAYGKPTNQKGGILAEGIWK